MNGRRRWILCGAVIGLMGLANSVAAEQVGADGALTKQLAALYQQSEAAIKQKDQAAYFSTLSQARVQRFDGMVKSGKVGSMQELMDKIAAMEADDDPAMAIPRFAEQRGQEATLVLFKPAKTGPASSGTSAPDDTIARVIFVQEAGGWKRDHEEWALKPAWMSLEAFDFSTQQTTLTPPATWSAPVADATAEQGALHLTDDLTAIAFAHDNQFLYIRATFSAPPKSGNPILLVYFDTDQNTSTGSTTRDDFGPKISGWERRLELRTSMGGGTSAPWAYEVVPGELKTPRISVPFEQAKGWVLSDGSMLLFKVPLVLLGVKPGDTFQFAAVDSLFKSLETVARGTYSLQGT